MHPSLVIASKDLRERVRDRSAIWLGLVVPLALALIFAALFGSAGTPRAFRYAVVDLDGGHIAGALAAEVLPMLEERGVVEVREVEDQTDGEQLVRDGDLDALFVIPADFSEAARSAAPAELRVVGNPDSPTGTAVAESVATSFVREINHARVGVAAAMAVRGTLPPDALERLAADATATPAAVVLDDRSADARLLDGATYYAAGMAVFFLLFTVQFGVSTLLEERSEGTLGRLLAAPLRPGAILVGKLLTSLLLGVLSMTVLVTATAVLMNAEWGDPLGVALLILAGVLAATGVTAVVASLARTPEQAGSWQAIIAVALGLLGGAFFPISQSGSLLATLSLATPHAWFLRGLGDLAGPGGALAVWPSVAALLVFAAVTLTFGLVRLGPAVRP
jgi:ABC-2 type transport system permease protein